jgi:para-aminobenzoate synthetase
MRWLQGLLVALGKRRQALRKPRGEMPRRRGAWFARGKLKPSHALLLWGCGALICAAGAGAFSRHGATGALGRRCCSPLPLSWSLPSRSRLRGARRHSLQAVLQSGRQVHLKPSDPLPHRPPPNSPPLKTLLIDNYDSYTYNLYQQLAIINGEAPHVVHNDAEGGDWAAVLDSLGFEPDCIILSPGPGHPGRQTDFGICRSALENCKNIPLLGVCLGHQGLALAHGASVGHAPVPMHGRLSKVYHSSESDNCIFKGVPQGAEVVRYHSLAVHVADEVSHSELDVLAWSEDGVIMALKHKHQPHWGVQFHPESIGTTDGPLILRNFRDAALEWNASKGGNKRKVETSRKPVYKSGVALHKRSPRSSPWPDLICRAIPFQGDPEAVFKGLWGSAETCWWLDSSSLCWGKSADARFSFMGAPGPDGEVLEYRGGGDLTVAGEPVSVPSILDYMKERVGSTSSLETPKVLLRTDGTELRRPARDCLPFDFIGGYAGFFGYELRHDTSAMLADMEGSEWQWPSRSRGAAVKGDAVNATGSDDEVPVSLWMRADRYIAFDHQEGHAYVVAEEGALGGWKWVEDTADAVRGMTAAPSVREVVNQAAADTSLCSARPQSQYEDGVRECLQLISEGETYEACLTNQFSCPPLPSDALSLYCTLRRNNPVPYAAFLRHKGLAVCCSSPERFLKSQRDRWIVSRPIKGTSPRGSTPTEDVALALNLASSEKTVSENLLIVDLVRNDLGRVCEIGTVEVPELMKVETFSSVHQLVSTIQGKLRPDCDVLDAVSAAFPGGSMTGAPKERTMEILHSLEHGVPRGIYSGSIGYLSACGCADLNIVIRTAVVTPKRVTVGAGGAIIAMSDPSEEYIEMILKAKSVLSSIAAVRKQDLQQIGNEVHSHFKCATGGGNPSTTSPSITSQ